ncbi:CRISPR system precrRNA processing endoribonuclease RAMP protein Cas6 [Fusibacter sp. 3D3]|uniref:CRISPR system precrRNA processing endoribonuclease RAMP protein Cas6 n=1 Tax=Fusibacter sp. 3D3 TaxID=1048380 RepID=UPI000852CB7B|nr:CRISPR system precrRNA processing endoribonuclease RAMP protein Cas6 [Fusibacter sp. 3D3]GAU79963.1 CRISPR repeat RNA endoribonuclease Cas6 [Fusibacter sp. 3D3]
MFGDFKIALYEFEYTALQDTQLNDYHGSMLRGLLGNQLRALFCNVESSQICETCSFNKTCLYVKLFYGINNQLQSDQKLSSYKLPNPFVIKPVMQNVCKIERGGIYKFQLLLIGESTLQYVPYYIIAAKEMTTFIFKNTTFHFKMTNIRDVVSNQTINMSQISNGHNGYRVDEINPLIVSGNVCAFKIKTPLRIQVKGKLINQISFEVYFKNALRRVTMLYELYHEKNMKMDHLKMIELSKAIRCLESNLKWTKVERYSVYKNEKISMGGLMGTCSFEGDFAPFIEIMQLSSLIHVGKSCTNGDGWIDIEFVK